MAFSLAAVCAERLPSTSELVIEDDIAVLMVDGLHRYLDNATRIARESRETYWRRDFTSHEAYVSSLQPNRIRLTKIIGAFDTRQPSSMQLVSTTDASALLAESDQVAVYQVKWPVLDGVYGEGLLLDPKTPAKANVIAIPDADSSPEAAAGLAKEASGAFAVRLAESGCRVLVPLLINRDHTYSGREDTRMTNQSHREYLYRPAYQMGRHVIGYEVQKVLGGVDWFQTLDSNPIGLVGYGEGGLIALYTAALDSRIDATCISGYFGPREDLWKEPIDRSVWSLLTEFGDAELASMILPRSLIIEQAPFPQVPEAATPTERRDGSPGQINTFPMSEVQDEVARANEWGNQLTPPKVVHLIEAHQPLQEDALAKFVKDLGLNIPLADGTVFAKSARQVDPAQRMKRQLDELMEHTQKLLREAQYTREIFWNRADKSTSETFVKTAEWYRTYFREEILGSLPQPKMPLNPRTRKIYDTETVAGYEVVVDVFPDVIAYGILLLPKNIHPGERRPVVVCQHGLEGRPQDTADPAQDSHYYHQFAYALAERGFITFSPQNPYIGGDTFRTLQRKANPLKLSLFSFIVRQHERIIDWLIEQPWTDSSRIAFYGLSYGGKTAMRVPPLEPRYSAVICSGDYNEWIWKTVSNRHKVSYLFTGEYEMFEFDLGNTFNYAELSWLIFPRPFMVERGHHDGVSVDEWVAYEFARTYRHYDLMGKGDNAEIEWFDGPHTIHGKGTFDFLHKHLNWPNSSTE
ncbi:MAG: hypothetical protein AMXMBFR84_12740 [Candidatus Hydrogenedentota bacterium]